jgi:3'-phosphoadenosine 5'-phosphosulfate sulfotransferase (PAPS reductase)/FAD synthetase
MSESGRTQIWSSGGGTQSTAIAALICQGELSPDLSIIVDTERELSTTWDYLDKWVMPALKAAGVILHVIPKSDYATVDLMRNDDVLIPAFTTESGSIGKLPTYCSNEWKQRVMRRWAVEQGVKQADVWIGFTIDEMKRVTQPVGKWQNKYPLIERRMTRGDCIALVKRMGWPDPPRSSCWMCPNKPHHEWEWQRINAPADFAKAVEFEKHIQTKDEDLWLTDTGRPLSEADFSKPDDLFTGRCTSGMCFV